MIEINIRDTGPGDTKPALRTDGNMHAGEVTGHRVLHYFIERILVSYEENFFWNTGVPNMGWNPRADKREVVGSSSVEFEQ